LKNDTFSNILMRIQASNDCKLARGDPAFAGLVGIGVPTLYGWHSGRRSPNPENISRLIEIATPQDGIALLEHFRLVPNNVELLIKDTEHL